MRRAVARIPVVGRVARGFVRVMRQRKDFQGSEQYWTDRYNSGGDSGAGSYHRLAEFKAEIVNGFVKANNILTVIEYGCGDGNQLSLAEYPSYVGFDVAPNALARCRNLFRADTKKTFKLMDEYKGERAQLTLSLDVIYHLVEDEIYSTYMERLFASSERFVVIYSSDYDEEQHYHERRRRFSGWVERNASQWRLIRHIPNRFPYTGSPGEGSLSDFYIYERTC